MTKQSAKRGRKEGSVSFMQVTLEELNRILKPTAKVIVSYKFAQIIGLNGKPVGGDLSVYTAAVGSNGFQAELEDFGGSTEGNFTLSPVAADTTTQGKQEEKPKQEEVQEDKAPLSVGLETWED